MVNNLEFSDRLKIVMEYYDLTSTALADSISVQRSSISHLLSGRNKPSLDFVLKVLQKYPEVELYWLMNGKGDFPKKEILRSEPTPLLSNVIESISKPIKSREKIEEEKTEEIEKIVIFYKNGTFKSYLP